jgi:hypothetical protein
MKKPRGRLAPAALSVRVTGGDNDREDAAKKLRSKADSQRPPASRRSPEEINRTWPLFDWWDHAPSRDRFDIFRVTRDADPLTVRKQIAQPRWVCIAEDAPPPELVAEVMERATVLMAGQPLPRSAYEIAGARAFHNQRVLLIEQPWALFYSDVMGSA